MSNIRIRNLPIAQIDEKMAREMFLIFSRYYVGVDFERFHADLQEKSECIFLYTDGDRSDTRPSGPLPGPIVGFSTIARRSDPGLRGATYLFSGDTVLDKAAWGRRLLERAFFWTMLREKLRAPMRPVHWMLISKGYVTYLMMVRNFPRSFPRFDRPTPALLQERMDRFYTTRYGSYYSERSGLVRFPQAHGAVGGRLAVPKGAMLADPDVGYFLDRNPGYQRGDELACIAEIRARDFLVHFATAFRRRRNRREIASARRRPRVTKPEGIDAPTLG